SGIFRKKCSNRSGRSALVGSTLLRTRLDGGTELEIDRGIATFPVAKTKVQRAHDRVGPKEHATGEDGIVCFEVARTAPSLTGFPGEPRVNAAAQRWRELRDFPIV